MGNYNLYYAQNVRLLIIMAYTVVKLPFSLRMIRASFYAIDEELEDAARNLGAGGFTTFMRVKLPIIPASVLAVFALNFNASLPSTTCPPPLPAPTAPATPWSSRPCAPRRGSTAIT